MRDEVFKMLDFFRLSCYWFISYDIFNKIYFYGFIKYDISNISVFSLITLIFHSKYILIRKNIIYLLCSSIKIIVNILNNFVHETQVSKDCRYPLDS